jgi:hypothetical protein
MGGNVEFWPYNDFAVNSAGVPNASSSLFDWGDTSDGVLNYGSMQIANHDASQMLLSFNHWNSRVTPDIGIGNNTNVDPIDNQVNPDWTFSANGNYQVQNLEVLVHPLAPWCPSPRRWPWRSSRAWSGSAAGLPASGAAGIGPGEPPAWIRM